MMMYIEIITDSQNTYNHDNVSLDIGGLNIFPASTLPLFNTSACNVSRIVGASVIKCSPRNTGIPNITHQAQNLVMISSSMGWTDITMILHQKVKT